MSDLAYKRPLSPKVSIQVRDTKFESVEESLEGSRVEWPNGTKCWGWNSHCWQCENCLGYKEYMFYYYRIYRSKVKKVINSRMSQLIKADMLDEINGTYDLMLNYFRDNAIDPKQELLANPNLGLSLPEGTGKVEEIDLDTAVGIDSPIFEHRRKLEAIDRTKQLQQQQDNQKLLIEDGGFVMLHFQPSLPVDIESAEDPNPRCYRKESMQKQQVMNSSPKVSHPKIPTRFTSSPIRPPLPPNLTGSQETLTSGEETENNNSKRGSNNSLASIGTITSKFGSFRGTFTRLRSSILKKKNKNPTN